MQRMVASKPKMGGYLIMVG